MQSCIIPVGILQDRSPPHDWSASCMAALWDFLSFNMCFARFLVVLSCKVVNVGRGRLQAGVCQVLDHELIPGGLVDCFLHRPSKQQQRHQPFAAHMGVCWIKKLPAKLQRSDTDMNPCRAECSM